jgi:hypothetical protein
MDGDEILYSDKEYDWLGPGAYFWESDPKRALEWARWKVEIGDYRDPSVVGAVIDLRNCLDLISREDIELFRAAHKSFLRLQARANLPVPGNRVALVILIGYFDTWIARFSAIYTRSYTTLRRKIRRSSRSIRCVECLWRAARRFQAAVSIARATCRLPSATPPASKAYSIPSIQTETRTLPRNLRLPAWRSRVSGGGSGGALRRPGREKDRRSP